MTHTKNLMACANGILEIRAPKPDVATRRKEKINVAQ